MTLGAALATQTPYGGTPPQREVAGDTELCPPIPQNQDAQPPFPAGSGQGLGLGPATIAITQPGALFTVELDPPPGQPRVQGGLGPYPMPCPMVPSHETER